MQAVILVGGEGTRLRPLTYGTPKPMVPLFGVPFLERTLGRLHAAGIDDVIMAAGYLPRAIVEHLGDGSRLGMRLTYVVEDAPLGTAGALKNVEEHIHGTFFVLNGDVLTSLDLSSMLAYHRRAGGVGTLHLIRVEDPSAFGCVVHDGGRVTRFVEKPPRDEAPTDEVNAGTYVLEREVLAAIPAGRSVSIEREMFPALLAAGSKLHAYVTNDYWLDVGRPEQYLQAHRDVLERALTLGPLADPDAHGGRIYFAGDPCPTGVLAPSFVGRNVAIESGAVVGPFAVVGDGSHVGAGANVLDCVLWSNVHVSDGASVSGAIVADGVRVGAGATIGAGSVIGHRVEIEERCDVPPHSRVSAVQAATT